MPPETYWIAPNVTFDALTIGPRHHFLASTGSGPWDENNRDILAMEIHFADRIPTEKDALSLGFIPYGTRRIEAFDKTFAWNWQHGAMLQWLPQNGRKVIYNQQVNHRYFSVIRDLESGAVRKFSLPIHAVSPTGDWALSLHNEAVYRLDLISGMWKLIFSLQQAQELNPVPSMNGAQHYFHMMEVNLTGNRLAVLHSWHLPIEEVHSTHLITSNPDGSEPHVLCDGAAISHYQWASENQIIACIKAPDIGRHYLLFDDLTGNKETIGQGILNCVDRLAFSPDKKWVLSETCRDENDFRTLFLWQWPHGARLDVARFYQPPAQQTQDDLLRCGLHPHWNRDGTKICIDSVHTGTRQIHILDVSAITKNKQIVLSVPDHTPG